jgi:RNA methyltransferase, TrmH family
MKRVSITSPHNPRYRAALRLRHARDRHRTGQFLIDGRREIARAIDAGIEILEWYSSELSTYEPLCQIHTRDAATTANCPSAWMTLPERLWRELSYGDRDSELVAVAKIPSAITVTLPARPCVAVLEGIEKPGNLGAIMRTACAAGIDAVFLADCTTDLYNPNVIRASTGALFSLPVQAATATAIRDQLLQQGLQIAAAVVDGADRYDTLDFSRSTAIVLGNEAQGLTGVWNHSDVRRLRIPMQGTIDSLNVSVTAAILFYEALRQRTRAASLLQHKQLP